MRQLIDQGDRDMSCPTAQRGDGQPIGPGAVVVPILQEVGRSAYRGSTAAVDSPIVLLLGIVYSAVQSGGDPRCSYGTPEMAVSVVCRRRRAGRLRTGDPSTQRDRIRIAAV